MLFRSVDVGRIDPAKTVTAESLVEAGIIRNARDGIRILADGELKAKLTIEAKGASKAAIAAVEKAGGSVKLLVKAPSEHSEKQSAKTKAKKSKSTAKASAAQPAA